MKLKKKFGQGVEIKWTDSYEYYGWGMAASFMSDTKTCMCVTKACYIGEDKNFIYVAHTVGKDAEEHVLGRLGVPRKAINSIRNIK